MADISFLAESEFDVMGALELHLWITDSDVTKRCMAHCLIVMQEEIDRAGGKSHVEQFLADIVKLLQATVKKKQTVTCNDMVSDMDLQKFYSGAHDAWWMTKKICGVLEEWPKKIGEDQVRRICWEYYFKESEVMVTKKEWLSPECTYRLFLIYNKLLLRDNTTDLEVGQVNAFLMKMVSISQYTWNSRLEYKPEGSKLINFPEFVTTITRYFCHLHLTIDFTCELIFELYQLIIEGILKKGYLEKKGHFRRNWIRRYFVLKMTTLSYYEDSAQTTHKKIMMLNRNTRLLNVKDDESPNHPNKFIVTCGTTGVDYHICAESKVLKHSWILAIQKALALSKMRCPSDRQEFMSALAEWTKQVYGENPNIAEENLHPVATAATLHLQQLMKDKVVENLVGDSSGAVQNSLPQDSEITDDTINDPDGYVKMTEKKTNTEYVEVPSVRGEREEQSGISSNVKDPEYNTAAMCVVIAHTKVRHSYINLDSDDDNGYSDSVRKKAVVVNDNSTPPPGKDRIADKGHVDGVQLHESPSNPKSSFDLKEENLHNVPTPSHPVGSKHSPSVISKSETQKVAKSDVPTPPGGQAVEQKKVCKKSSIYLNIPDP